MKPATLEFLKQRFQSYYNGEIKGAGAVYTPASISEREWGFLFFSADRKSGMRRHMSFNSIDEANSYMKNIVPSHVYYSTAYYARPSAATMKDKQWLGADLIFDLDADLIVRGAYDVMLDRVKSELFKLIDVLTDELGFSKNDLNINFSGGRGYHIHIQSMKIRNWNSAKRRELADYVSGTGISAESMLTSAKNIGWQKRYRESLNEELRYIKELEMSDALSYLTGLSGISDKFAIGFLKNIDKTMEILSKSPSKLTENKVIKAIADAENKSFQSKVLSKAALVDEPVTTDIKRLIRHPGSLHGGSGFRVMPIDINDLDSFDPLVDAVVFSDRNMKVECPFNLSMQMMDNKYDLVKGQNTVPEALAVFLCCRGIAEISGGL
ncbi:MAG TPA: DNA primase catalytic subunit PriS [Methanocorpusculum sp.]|nr:DNA primase catalytic subunit PriS [Methanocorpusculum sp.]